MEAALETLTSDAVEPRIQALLDRAEVRHFLFDPPGIRRYATEALLLAERIGRDDLAAQATCRLGLAESSEGKVRAAVRHYEQAFARAGTAHLATLVSGIQSSGLNLYWLGKYDAAIKREPARPRTRAGDTRERHTRQSRSTTWAWRSHGEVVSTTMPSSSSPKREQFALENRTEQWLAAATTMRSGVHLEVFDYEGAEQLAEKARRSREPCDWPPASSERWD